MQNRAARSHFFLIAAVAFFTLARSVTAQFSFTTNNGAITITGYSGAGPSVIIPPTLNGYPVTTIGSSAFGGATSVTSVSIPTSVTNIGAFAFTSSGLTSAAIPSGVLGIGQQAFASCENLTNISVAVGNPAFSSLNGVLFDGKQDILIQYPPASVISVYTVPTGVDTINNYAFYGALDLASITIPATVASIGDDAFAYCEALNTVYFGGTAPNLGNDAFYQTGFGNGVMIFFVPGTTGWTVLEMALGPSLASSAFWYQSSPSIMNFGLNGNQFGFTISWDTNASVVVEANGNPSDPVWTPISTNAVTKITGVVNFTDSVSKSRKQRYYRLRGP